MHLFVDFFGGLLAAIPLKTSVRSGKKRGCLALGAARQPNLFSHPKKADHLPRQSRSALQIVLGSGRNLVKNFFLRSASSERTPNPIQQFGARHEELLTRGKLHRITEGRAPTRNDA